MNTKMNFAIIILMGLITQSFANQKVENDRTEANLQGKVRSCSEFFYKAEDRFGKLEKGSLNSKYTYRYDEKGNKTEQTTYNPDGSLNKNTYKYSENGKLTEVNEYDSDGSLHSTSKYEYDNQGNWIKRIDFEDAIPKHILEREYEYYN